jgi:hypothetical protein
MGTVTIAGVGIHCPWNGAARPPCNRLLAHKRWGPSGPTRAYRQGSQAGPTGTWLWTVRSGLHLLLQCMRLLSHASRGVEDVG